MRKPRVFKQPQIIAAALELIRERGWKHVTARSIAAHLGSSTMPIYSHMKSLDDLEQELKVQARAIMKEYQTKSYSGNALLDIAVGYVVFARDEKQLFRFLYLDKPDAADSEDVQSMRDLFYTQFGADIKDEQMLAQVHDTGQEALIRNSHIYTHGLAMMVNTGVLISCSNEVIMKYLEEAGEAFYLLVTQKEERGE